MITEGLKQHSHEERERITQALVLALRSKVGEELEAIAATGSFARNTDAPFSDIELIVFVKNKPREPSWDRFIFDGMMIDLWFLTRQSYISTFKSGIDDEWPYAALSALKPLFNESFVCSLRGTPVKDDPAEYDIRIKALWPDLQESTAKVLAAADRGDFSALPFLYWKMAEKICVVLSFLNRKPFTTRAVVFSEIQSFDYLPNNIGMLIASPGDTLSIDDYRRNSITLFSELEKMIQDRGMALYGRTLDSIVFEKPKPKTLWDRMGGDRILRKLVTFAVEAKSSAGR